jgi:monoamine oxidase
LGIQPGREPETAAWLSEGRRRDTSAEQLAALLGEGMAAACHDAAELMPVPFEIRAEASGADRLSVAERLDRTGLRAEVRDLLRGGLGTLSSAPLAEAGYVPTALKAFALASSDAGVFLEQNASHTIRGGTRALVEAMAADARADVALSTDVVSVRRSADAVTLTANGTQMRARAAVMAVPLNALRRIDFDPPLSAAKRRVAWAGQASRGAKLFLRIRGHHAPLMILAPEEHHLTLLEWAGTIEDDTLLVGFASTNRVLSDRGLLGRAVADLLPGAEVLDVLAHDWTSDPLAGGTWCTLRPGQFTGALQELRRSEGRLVFAGGDIAAGWLGYIDGAIETGLSAARQVRALLS